jgi:hypothetical protein
MGLVAGSVALGTASFSPNSISDITTMTRYEKAHPILLAVFDRHGCKITGAEQYSAPVAGAGV